jgi:hypothetical protein
MVKTWVKTSISNQHDNHSKDAAQKIAEERKSSVNQKKKADL